ncbi:hypothetical protein [Actinomadura decatromicini]|uniref:Heparin-binding hemagglutinin n=1 Tax=Actinomadura decatromicini TaxID=2604572 RepID=A0A5D3F7T0_9ACTN|nr:hypothetical protein [Actinomadura decatromicini]TYK43770.1 hypothetical protein FXF68_37160 [Actinomadura decatromicini]
MTLANNLRENKAVYAVAGAGDFAVEKLREMPEQMTRYQDRAREISERYQGEVRETVDRYRGQVRQAARRYRGEVSRYQGRVDAKDLPGAAVAYATEFGTRAVGFFDELAERGKRVVHREAADVAEITDAPARPAAKPAAARSGAAAKPAPKARAAQPRKSTQPRSTAKKNGA